METSALKKYETKWFTEGEQIGIAKGEKKLEEEKKRMAHMMLQEGMDIQKISKITGISAEEIQALEFT